MNLNGAYAHIKACAKRPSDAQLREDREHGLSYKQLHHKYGVAWETVKKWVQEAGAISNINTGRGPSVPSRKTYPALAPMFGRTRAIPCSRCIAKPYCEITIPLMAWMLCEAPDEDQIKMWERNGLEIGPCTPPEFQGT